MGLLDDELKETCRKLKPFIGTKADQLWLAYTTSRTRDAKERFASYINAYSAKLLSDTVDDASILLPPPSRKASAGEFYLGQVIYKGEDLYPLRLTREDFTKHMTILATTGQGKTNVAQILLMGLLEKGIPFMVIDWKRAYRDLLSIPVETVKRIKIYTVGRKYPAPFNWNPLRPPPGVDVRTWIKKISEALERSHISGAGVGEVFTEILDKEFATRGFYDGAWDRYPNFYDAKEKIKTFRGKGRRGLWEDSFTRIINDLTFGPGSGAFNAINPIKLESLLEHSVIFELDQELPEMLRKFFSEVILRWLHLYRLHQHETSDLRHVLFLEEIHNLFPKTQAEKNQSNSLESVFREIRGFAQGLVGISQHPSVLPIYVLGNANTQIYMPLIHEDDIMSAKRSLFLNRGEEKYLDALKTGEGLVKIKGRTDPCFVRFPLVPITKGVVTDEVVHERMKDELSKHRARDDPAGVGKEAG